MKPDAEILATLLADPERADVIAREELPEVIGAVERLRAVLWSRLNRPDPPAENGSPSKVSDVERARGDRMMTVREVAERLGLDARQVYRRADSWPFTHRLGGRTLRFSARGLEQWLERQK